ncbi:WD-40 repeat-containing protein [Naegleria gruberi]|uniref:WD-40 repeat-containing protein n=1 Tax=Naegleria gruberi TaxID=5762 RepID=D2VSA6_NAEGR|nr:WD-40 repeat-containing protein [Naegleria gruberi]EFC40310.1 WD-40 repeat-containing protein [Naegleria gruberi]|eukprot:XP_002673054.1 WD-40 repeat-containing protein [Naegleria gruberi strain NEG-M]
MAEINLQEAISNARLEAQQLKEKINAQRKVINDVNMKDLDVAEISPLKLKERRVFKGHSSKVASLAWSKDSKTILTAGQDRMLILWDAVTTYKLSAIPLQARGIMCCDYSTSGNYVCVGGLDNICSVFSLSAVTQQLQNSSNEYKPFRQLVGHTGYLSSCKFISDRHILTSSGDQSCIFWDVEMTHAVSHFQEHTGDCMAVSVSPIEQNVFVSGSCDGSSKLWDVRMNKCVATFTGHEGDINSVQFFPNGNAFATGSDDCTCRLFDLRASREVMTYSDDNVREGVTSISFSKSGRVLFAAYEDKKVIAWDSLKGTILQTLDGLPNGHDNRVSCLAVSPDGHALATGSWDMTMKIFA